MYWQGDATHLHGSGMNLVQSHEQRWLCSEEESFTVYCLLRVANLRKWPRSQAVIHVLTYLYVHVHVVRKGGQDGT